LVTFAAKGAEADPLRFHGGAAAAHALGDPQQSELSFGTGVQAGAEWMLSPQFSFGAKGVGLWLTPGEERTDPTLKSERGASLYGAAVQLNLYPFATGGEPVALDASGLWLSAAGGGATTGGRVRPMLDVYAGWDAFVISKSFVLGPMLGWLHVFQPNDRVRPEDADVALLGINGRFWFEPPEAPRDTDGDGVPDERDACPKVAEDPDGFEDDDGCPDPDNDQDGVPDSVDQCVDQPEDPDGFEDDDGCPDADSDTPSETDKDRDGVPDADDKCPNEPEDKDQFEDEDGCPDPDNDNDGVPDAQDLCPNERETLNDYADHDGCPDEDQVRVIGGEIILDEVVRFPTNSAVISAESHALLERLAKLVREHPEYVHISIEGHADVRGPEAHNQVLSAARAQAGLEFLVKQGIERERLSSKGFGSQRPVEPGRDARAFSKNRRVEFVVTRAASPPSKKGPQPGQGSEADKPAKPVEPKKPEAPSSVKEETP